MNLEGGVGNNVGDCIYMHIMEVQYMAVFKLSQERGAKADRNNVGR